MNTQAKAQKSQFWDTAENNINSDGYCCVQWVKADAAAVGVVDGSGQQMI
jgi:hypothetical protein